MQKVIGIFGCLALGTALLAPTQAARAQATTRNGAQMSVGAVVLPSTCWTSPTLSAAERTGCADAIAAARATGQPLPPAAAQAFPPVITTETDAQGNTRVLRVY